ncbi:MAG: carboxypeptidase regulatory-like domain-containing protein, partial [Terriglobia bacterium]
MAQRKQGDDMTGRPPGNPRGPSRGAWGITLVVAALFTAGWLHAQTQPSVVQGRVINATTGRPVPNVQVSYVQMTQGPTPVAQATTDGEGRFRLEGPPAVGPAPILLRVDYQGATYSHPVLPGSPT